MSKVIATNRDEKEKHIKAIWDDISTDAFIQAYVAETLKGNRPNGHLSKAGWNNVIKTFKEKTGRGYEFRQMKNKWSALKKDWQIWTDLVGTKTGLGWDSLRQTVDATPEWWEEKLKVKPEAAKFRLRGLQNADQLDILFKDIAVTGDGAWAPSQGFVPESGSSRNADEYDDIIVDTDQFNDTNQNATNETEYSIHTTESHTQDKGKKRKIVSSGGSIANKLYNQLERVCESIYSRRRDFPGCSILEVMDALRDLPGVVEGDELFMKAADIFVKRENRELFVAMKKPEIQAAWLKQKKFVNDRYYV